MGRLQHITIASDFSEGALAAVDRGFLIAQETGARCEMIHALGLDALAPLRALLGVRATEVSDKIAEDARARLQAQTGQTRHGAGVATSLRVEAGLAAQVIHARAQASSADLVVAGSHGSGFWQRWVLGSTTSSLLRKSRCPVLVVRQRPAGPYQRVLVPVDFSRGSMTSLRLARTLAPQAHLVLLHVFDVPFEGKMHMAGVDDDVIHQYRIEARERASQQLLHMVEDLGLTNALHSQIVAQGDAAHQVVALATQHCCDLIVMGKHGTHVTEELLLGSVTLRVLAESDSDVLVVVDDLT